MSAISCEASRKNFASGDGGAADVRSQQDGRGASYGAGAFGNSAMRSS